MNTQLDEVVTLMGGPALTSNDRKKIDMILTIDVHIRDIIEAFVRDSIEDPTEFEWESQLRFTLQSCLVHIFIFRDFVKKIKKIKYIVEYQ